MITPVLTYIPFSRSLHSKDFDFCEGFSRELRELREWARH